ncbi:barren-domain-containing protein [Ramicandelaber brevisporus]|nr:barren-domain-containing protein [Ramicandelaber brevisporus]
MAVAAGGRAARSSARSARSSRNSANGLAVASAAALQENESNKRGRTQEFSDSDYSDINGDNDDADADADADGDGKENATPSPATASRTAKRKSKGKSKGKGKSKSKARNRRSIMETNIINAVNTPAVANRRKSALNQDSSGIPPTTPAAAAASSHSTKTPSRRVTIVPTAFLLSPSAQQQQQQQMEELQALSAEERQSRYETWMKLSFDNKFNQDNAWRVQLIEFFSDMRILMDGSTVNFQRASCTLDASVKVYSSRVDSAATETGKLLNGLTDTMNSQRKRRNHGNDGDMDDNDDDGDGGDGSGTTRRGKKRAGAGSGAAKQESTLAKNWAAVTLPKLDLEFEIDPLFRKTSAELDEGGTRGMLLNRLSVDRHGKIILDSRDAILPGENDDEEDESSNKEEDEESKETDASEMIELNGIPGEILQQIQRSSEANEQICQQLSTFEFSSDTTFDMSILHQLLEDNDDDDDSRGGNMAPFGAVNSQFGVGGMATSNYMDHFDSWSDDGGGGDPGAGYAPGPDDGFEGYEMDDPNAAPWGSGLANGDTSNGHVMGGSVGFVPINSNNEDSGLDGSVANVLNFLDTMWGGSGQQMNHWKLAPYLRTRQGQLAANQQPSADGDENDSAVAAANGRKKNSKAAAAVITLDFLNAPAPDTMRLFAAPGRLASLKMLVKDVKAMPSKEYLLPPQSKQFTSRNLFSLHLKPKMRLKHVIGNNGNRRVHVNNQSSINANGSGDLHERFGTADDWGVIAQQDFGENGDSGGDGGEGGGWDMNGEGGGAGWPTFGTDDGATEYEAGYNDEHDDDDDALDLAGDGAISAPTGGDIANTLAALSRIGGDGGGMIGGMAGIGGYSDDKTMLPHIKLVTAQHVKYTKVAKHVDLKRLKDNIWRGLSETPSAVPSLNDTQQSIDGEVFAATQDQGEADGDPKNFTSIMSTLKDRYSEKRLKDITVPFCFICLLHLANERGLEIKNTGDGNLNDLVIRQPLDSNEHQNELEMTPSA